MLTVRVSGLNTLETWLTKVAKGLEQVPERFSDREDVKRNLQGIARLSLVQFGIEWTGAAIDNIQAESTPDHRGIMVYEALNSATASKAGAMAGSDPYILFFLEEYAAMSFLRPQGVAQGRDFFRLWPALMRSTVVDAFEEEVRKVMAK